MAATLNQPPIDEHLFRMKPVILKLLRQETVTTTEWQDLFHLSYTICLWNNNGPQEIYNHLQRTILDRTKQVEIQVLTHQEDKALLKTYVAEWRKFFTQCRYVYMPFRMLELTLEGKFGCSYSDLGFNENSIVIKLMLDCWNDSIFSNMKEKLQDIAMKLVYSERNGESFDSQLVIGVRESYVNLCTNAEDKLLIYREHFEKAYRDETEAFYQAKAPQYLEENGVQNYMKYAEQKLKEEEQRAAKYLEPYPGSKEKQMKCCVGILVIAFKDVILPGCPVMIKYNETEKLNLMFKLMDRAPDGVVPMLKELEHHIIKQGLADMIASADTITQDCEKYVEQLLTLFVRFSKLVEEAFNNDPRFLTSRDKGFNHVVNDTSVFRLELPSNQKSLSNKVVPESRCPELIANYCDMLLRKTSYSRKLTSDQIEEKLKGVLIILKYVQNKDVFMTYYKAHLTRRLILETSADSEKEENMIEWLRDIGMTAGYVNRLARMFQDIKVSEDLNQQFKETQRNRGSLTDSVNVKILNAGAWARNSQRIQVSLPAELEDFVPEVEEFYRQKHTGKKLQWYHQISSGTITFNNTVGKFDLDVTTFQMSVLFAWSLRQSDRISFENLKLATELQDCELRRTLWSLVACPKLKSQILLCSPEAKSPKDFDDGSLFWVNQEFSVIKNNKPQTRGRINLIGRLQLSTEKNREEDNESIVRLRVLRTQEAIVKIMKMRKKMTYGQLQTELVEILKNLFLPSRKLIKEEIEWLIEQKYIRRDEDDINVFIYVA